jgi:hypothetical protein
LYTLARTAWNANGEILLQLAALAVEDLALPGERPDEPSGGVGDAFVPRPDEHPPARLAVRDLAGRAVAIELVELVVRQIEQVVLGERHERSFHRVSPPNLTRAVREANLPTPAAVVVCCLRVLCRTGRHN